MAYLCPPRYSAYSPADRAGRAPGTAAASQPIRAPKRGRPPRSPAASSGPERARRPFERTDLDLQPRSSSPDAGGGRGRTHRGPPHSKPPLSSADCLLACCLGCGQAPGPMRTVRLRMLRSGRPSAACPAAASIRRRIARISSTGMHAPNWPFCATAMPAKSTPSRAKWAIRPGDRLRLGVTFCDHSCSWLTRGPVWNWTSSSIGASTGPLRSSEGSLRQAVPVRR
jgi:hypothetical protein